MVQVRCMIFLGLLCLLAVTGTVDGSTKGGHKAATSQPRRKKRSSNKAVAFLDDLKQKYSHQPAFLQAVQEIAESLQPMFEDPVQGDFYRKAFQAMTEPERIISFKVPWEDDQGRIHYNRGWRVEFSSALGPYKGGLRFHPSVDEGILKFLGFEQIFKNALTGLPLGGGKGGSDFDPKGKSESEVRRFCQSFMTELSRYLHPSTDVPAGDIGVGGREIGFMYGTYKRMKNKHGEGVLTGKSLLLGGSPLRPEATGYGLVYITNIAIQTQFGRSLKDLRCAISGSGNVAQFAADKVMELGGKVTTMSDSTGMFFFKDGMTEDDYETIMTCKNRDRGRLSSLEGKLSGEYRANSSPWDLEGENIDVALPCATQNEIDEQSAKRLVENGMMCICEGANMPVTLAGQQQIRKAGTIVYIPGKAANAGGVGVSGFEMSQNAQRLTWEAEEVDKKLQKLMADIYSQLSGAGSGTTLEQGANRAGFTKVALAMKDLGWLS